MKPWDELEKVQTERARLVARFKILNERERVLQRQCLQMIRWLPDDLLTRRENEVLIELQSSIRLTNKEIAGHLNISESTVKFHMTALFAKFGVKDRRELINAEKLEKL
jgi:DNA-binding CsgD family transcriptional regulator